MATTHRDTLLGRINNIPVTDFFSAGQRAQLRNAYASETENVCLATLNANPTDQGLIDEAVSRFPTQTAQGAAPAVEQASQLFTAPTAPLFTGLEKNGDPNATILSRDLQINKITSWADDISLDKTAVATFISTRGMGKTFLLKRTCDIQHRRIQEARQKARIISFDGSEVRTTKDAYMLWKKAIIRHIRVLFHNCEIDGIIFKSSDLENANTVDSTVYPTLSKWISGVMNSSLTDAVNELVRLTDIAIPTDGIQRATCMFLLDNVQSLVSLDTHLTSEGSASHTSRETHLLDALLASISFGRHLIIIAGTSDHNLNKLCDHSTYRLTRIPLNILSTMDDAYIMGQEIFAYRNKEGQHITLPPGLLDTEKRNQCSHYLESAIYEACQIPRLLNVVFNKYWDCLSSHNKFLPQTITAEITKASRELYFPGWTYLLKFEVRDVALLFLHSRTQQNILNEGTGEPVQVNLPSTGLSVLELIEAGIIFPYNSSIVIPSLLWSPENHQETVRDHLTTAQQCIQKYGLSPKDLCVDVGQWWIDAYSTNRLGCIWERMLVSSIMARWIIASDFGKNPNVAFRRIYNLSQGSSQFSALPDIEINLTNGIKRGLREHQVQKEQCDYIGFNEEINNAHHDFNISGVMPCQAKLSFTQPTAEAVSKQLLGTVGKALLWFFIGHDEDHPKAPKHFRKSVVKDAIKRKQLVILNGAGCVSPLNVDLFIALKKVLRAFGEDTNEE